MSPPFWSMSVGASVPASAMDAEFERFKLGTADISNATAIPDPLSVVPEFSMLPLSDVPENA